MKKRNNMKKQSKVISTSFHSKKGMKKGQAAMEFMMTYGWSILVALLTIGALVYFGVLNPAKWLPESCNVQGFYCVDFKVSTTKVELFMQNNIGDDISSISIIVDGCGTGSNIPSWLMGQEKLVAVTCNPNLISGAKFKQAINVTYTTSISAITHKKVGEIIGKVE